MGLLSLLALASLSLPLLSTAEDPFWPIHAREDGDNFDSTTCHATPLLDLEPARQCAAPYSWAPYEGDWSAWSFRPYCVPPLTYGNAITDQRDHYCLFVSRNFSEGRGIAAFTTPRTVESMVLNEAFRTPESIRGMNDLIGGAFGPPPYKSHVFPGKGIGLVANRTLYRGERIMQETVTWIYDRNVFGKVAERNRIPMHWTAMYRLPEVTRDELLALHKHHGGDEVDDIMRTNAFGAFYTDNDLHNNVLPRISRFNHDCRPNAHYYFDPNTMTQYVHATKEIAPGEEITINYTDSEYSFAERQSATMTSWGFACTCSICRQPADHVHASDKRLAEIKRVKEMLNDWTEPRPDRPKMAEYLVKLYEQERLHAPIATAYEAAAYAYSVIGDEYNTAKWAGLAVEALTILYGSDHELTQDLETLMLKPREHRTWNFSLGNEAKSEDGDLVENW